MSQNKNQKTVFDKDRLTVALTEDEKTENRVKIAELLDEIDAEEILRKAAADEFKRKIDSKEGTVRSLRGEIKWGVSRDIEVKIVYDYKTKKATYYRMDTGEEYRTRDLSSIELQFELPMDDKEEKHESQDVETIAEIAKGYEAGLTDAPSEEGG